MSFRTIVNHSRLDGFFTIIVKHLALTFKNEDHLTASLMLVVADR